MLPLRFQRAMRKTQGTAGPAVHKSRAGASLCLPWSLPVIPIIRTKRRAVAERECGPWIGERMLRSSAWKVRRETGRNQPHAAKLEASPAVAMSSRPRRNQPVLAECEVCPQPRGLFHRRCGP